MCVRMCGGCGEKIRRGRKLDRERNGEVDDGFAVFMHLLLFHILCTSQVVAQTIQLSIDEFVVELLVRLCEPHTADTHLAKFCK